MCYSAQIEADYRKYKKLFGADIDIHEFVRLYWDRRMGSKIKIPKAMGMPFSDPGTDDERRIKTSIDAFDTEQIAKLEDDLAKQRTRLADAERALQSKPTKAATERKRIATDKIAWTLGKLADLRRIELTQSDSRIFPGQFAPVMVVENGRRIVKPMRYQCRPAGKPADYDVKYPGTYNARRDNLEGFWKELFGHSHGLMIVNSFYENVSRHRLEQRELVEGQKDEKIILEFKPKLSQELLVACLWSRWKGKGESDLLSFAIVTTDPPPEIAIAGHDRCIVPIKPEHVDAWLNPDPTDLAAQYAILDDPYLPYYEYQVAA
jgi:putative SOS response-associated peptidase YedK